MADLSQRIRAELAFVALEIEKYEAGKAKERQGARNDIVALMPPSDAGKAREKAASQVGISPRYVQDAKRLEQEAPALAAECKTGKKTITQAMREVKEAAREQRREAGRLLAQAREQSPTGSGWHRTAGVEDKRTAELLIELGAGGVPAGWYR